MADAAQVLAHTAAGEGVGARARPWRRRRWGRVHFSERSLRLCGDFERSKVCCTAAMGRESATQQPEQRCAAMRPLRLPKPALSRDAVSGFPNAQNDPTPRFRCACRGMRPPRRLGGLIRGPPQQPKNGPPQRCWTSSVLATRSALLTEEAAPGVGLRWLRKAPRFRTTTTSS